MQTAGQRGWQHATALFLYAILSVIVTWPVAARFGSEALGEHYFDRTQNIWNLWWVKTALLTLHTNPFHTDLLLYPRGADLYFHTLNLPSTLLSLPVQLLSGPVAAYNFSMLLALALSGYAAFRLVYYVTGSFYGALVGGVIFGFSPIAFFQLRGHTQMVSMQWLPLCIEFYLRTWNRAGDDDSKEGAGKSRATRDAILTGLFFVLALLTVGYYEVQLLIFFLAHTLAYGMWALLAGRARTPRARLAEWLHRAKPLFTWSLGTAVLLSLPYLLGAWRSLQSGEVVPQTADDLGRAVADSADLLSLFVPSHNHWLLGAAPWRAGVNPDIHDLAYLGISTLLLAGVGLWTARSRAKWLWAGLALLGVTLALGPVLQINGQQQGLPMPFSLLEQVPVINLVRAPERFMISAYLGLAVLAGWGVRWLTSGASIRRIGRMGSPGRGRTVLLALLLGVLLFEMPLHEQYTEALAAPKSVLALASEKRQGAVLELPLTQHGWVETNRMAYQITHGRAITSGFLSRPVVDPYTDACSPLRFFTIGAPDAEELAGAGGQASQPRDVVAPSAASQLPAILESSGFSHILVYKQDFYSPRGLSPVPGSEEARLQGIAGALGTPIASDEIATTYRLTPSGHAPGPYLQLGDGWHALETSSGQPFRWIDGSQASVCMADAAPLTAPLAFSVASFGAPRHLRVSVGGKLVLDETVPADGAQHRLTTAPIAWGTGPQRVRLEVPEGSASPASLTSPNPSKDNRQLSLGFGSIRLEIGSP